MFEAATPAVGFDEFWAQINASAASNRSLSPAEAPLAPDRGQAEAFARLLFDGLSGFVNLRAIEEPAPKGRKAIAKDLWIPIDADLPKRVGDYVEECARTGHAAFLLPAAVEQGQGGIDGMKAMRVLPVDIDKGDVDGKLQSLTEALGQPWLVVNSGGIERDTGQAKKHAYFRIAGDVQQGELPALAVLRRQAAERFGADTKVGRNIAQILRVPGSLHRKPGEAVSRCEFVAVNGNSACTLDHVRHTLDTAAKTHQQEYDFDFNHNVVPLFPGEDVNRALTDPILAEGKSPDGLTRFEGAGEAIGHYIRMVRDGRMTLDEAWKAAKDWNAAILRPSWDEERLRGDFDRLVRIDINEKGQFLPAPAPVHEWARFDQWTANAYRGVPVQRPWLIEGILPLGIPGVVCAQGGLGKSFIMLDLALRIATGAPQPDGAMDFNDRFIFGGEVKQFGTAVMFTAEDDWLAVHERVHALDPEGARHTAPERFRVIPMPDAGGARALFVADREGYRVSAEFEAIRAWLKTLPNLKLVCFDPLQTFVAADITTKPEAGQFVLATMGALGAELKATVLVTHHAKKTERPISSPEEMRNAVRGTTAIVDGVRWVYGFWPEALGDDSYIAGAVLKANGKADMRVHKYRRLPSGVLRQLHPTFTPGAHDANLATLETAIIEAAQAGAPFTQTGASGLFDQRHRLPEEFKKAPKKKLVGYSQALLDTGRLVKTTARGGGTGRNWLDAPGGKITQGAQQIMSGSGLPS